LYQNIIVLASSTLIVITEHRPKQNVAWRWCYELTFFKKVKHMVVAFVCYLSPHKNFKEPRSFDALLPHHNFMPGVTDV